MLAMNYNQELKSQLNSFCSLITSAFELPNFDLIWNIMETQSHLFSEKVSEAVGKSLGVNA